MPNDIIPFDFDGNAVRVLLRDGDPWFVAKDVCDVLEIGNHRDSVSRMDDDEKDCVGITDAIGRLRDTTVVSESGLYALIFTSRKPEARRFRKWVTSEVLPSIRRNGSYLAPGLRVSPDQPLPSLTLKQAARLQAMHAAVQTAKLAGGTEEDVKRLYEEYCALFAAKPVLNAANALPSAYGLVEEFVDRELDITDADPARALRPKKTQAKKLHKMFRSWCRGRGVAPTDIPALQTFARAVRHIDGVERVSPRNFCFFNLVPRRNVFQ